MKLIVEMPQSYQAEREYILSVILRDFLGLDYDCSWTRTSGIRISASNECELILADVLFQTTDKAWLTKDSLPRLPLESWKVSNSLPGANLVSPTVPVIYGLVLPNGGFIHSDHQRIQLGLDIFGSAFFMLTRYEEFVKDDTDLYGRFPAQASLAYQQGFLERPIINEYAEILWACLSSLWPQLERSSRQYQVIISHDVDHPLSVVNKSWSAVLKNAAGDLMRRKDVTLVPRRFYARATDNFDVDPNNTFDFIMATSERHGLQSAFYFITDHTAGAIDGEYSIEMPWIRNLMRHIHVRGHEIGLHTSFNTFRDVTQTNKEFGKLLQCAEEEGIFQNEWGGRQHFLRWNIATTWQNWADVGLDYDSTLSFADHVGFRCGTCYEYAAFDLQRRQTLHLRERPLIVMETTLFGKGYMRLSPEAGQGKIWTLGKICRMFDGQFTLLWHNNTLAAAWQRRLYKETIEGVV